MGTDLFFGSFLLSCWAMPRTARIILPNFPHHVIQRGHNRQMVFADEDDYQYYLNNLWEWKEKLGCCIYAYCLMTNHVHLVVDPGRKPARLSLLMKRVAGRQTRYVNALEHRSGTLWEGRFKSSPIQRDAYLFACCRYIELNPVRAGLVASPRDYRWSSYRSRAGWEAQTRLDLDEGYLSLGATPQERAKHYRAWVRGAIPEGEWENIRQAIQRGQLTGGDRFVGEVAKKIGRRIERRGQGRPLKK